MIYLIPVLLCFTLIGVKTTDLNNDNSHSCKPNFTNQNNETVNLTEYCMEKTCIPRCCGHNEVILFNFTRNNKTEISCANELTFKDLVLLPDYSKLKIYKSDIEADVQLTTKDFEKDFTFVHNKVLLNKECGQKWITNKFKAYLLENGKFAGDMRNIQGNGWHIKETEMYCVDRIVFTKNDRYKSDFAYYVVKDEQKDNTYKIYFTGVGMLISSFFLLLVLLVYCVLPQLRNLSGMLLMAYVVTQFLAFFFKAICILLPKFHFTTCEITSPIQYFLFLSSILWLNIMSFDIWWTFRGMRLRQSINRQGEVVKFLWYALYAWGVATLMTIGAVLIDKAKWLKIIRPAFDTCFQDETANLHYLYAPIGILTLVNIVLFGMTVYNMWLIGKILKDFNSSSSSKNNQSRFRLYIKMSLVMGISWVLEVVQSNYDFPYWIFVIINLYNVLIGVPIFLLFIFNRTTLVMLCKRFNIKSKFVQDLKLNSSTKSSVSRTRSSHIKGCYTKARNMDESDVEMFGTEVTTDPKNKIDQPE